METWYNLTEKQSYKLNIQSDLQRLQEKTRSEFIPMEGGLVSYDNLNQIIEHVMSQSEFRDISLSALSRQLTNIYIM